MNETNKEILGGKSTYIIKGVEETELDVKTFIYNRGSDYIGYLFSDKYVRWFELYELSGMYSCGIEILEHVNIDNTRRKNQKKINDIKRKYIEKYNASKANTKNETLCNKQLNTSGYNFRNHWKKNYDLVFDTIMKMQSERNKIYNVIKDIWKAPYKHMLFKPKYLIFSYPGIDIEHKAVMIVFKEYLIERIKRRCCMPFAQETNRLIPSIIKGVIINSKIKKNKTELNKAKLDKAKLIDKLIKEFSKNINKVQ